MSTLDEFATTRNSTFSDADVMRYLTIGFDIVAAEEAVMRLLVSRSLVVTDGSRGLIIEDGSRGITIQ